MSTKYVGHLYRKDRFIVCFTALAVSYSSTLVLANRGGHWVLINLRTLILSVYAMVIYELKTWHVGLGLPTETRSYPQPNYMAVLY